MSTEWLSINLGAPGVKVVESDEDVLLYDIGHIPGAVKIDGTWTSTIRSHAITSTARRSPT